MTNAHGNELGGLALRLWRKPSLSLGGGHRCNVSPPAIGSEAEEWNKFFIIYTFDTALFYSKLIFTEYNSFR